jgi:hypothetical protein
MEFAYGPISEKKQRKQAYIEERYRLLRISLRIGHDFAHAMLIRKELSRRIQEYIAINKCYNNKEFETPDQRCGIYKYYTCCVPGPGMNTYIWTIKVYRLMSKVVLADGRFKIIYDTDPRVIIDTALEFASS